jgi:phosphoribosyl-ATP pyrophosphohydrolase
MNQADFFAELHGIVQARLEAEPQSSYVASLNAKGLDAVLKKIGEEATELVMAAKDGGADEIIYETADLWFHTLVLLAKQGLTAQMVIDELARRMGTSGLEEKAKRSGKVRSD